MTEIVDRLAAALADRYRLEREVGAGGMATVYLAQDLKHDRKVAIKVLRPELAAVIGVERFLREIQTIAALQHPHILGLIDSGTVEVEGQGSRVKTNPSTLDPGPSTFVYYVMPYVDGESLRDRLNREKQLPIADAVRLATEVAGALDYAHRHGVIHRDIKPENILLQDGSALVADFGIALAASKAGGSRMTETGMSLGTPHYMSPEQAMGEREITARSDVYALGAVTYEMLIGEPPFTGPTAQSIVAKVMTTEPAGLIVQRKSVPPAVEEAVLTALQKLPADRFASAAEFALALAGQGPSATVRISAQRIAPRRRSIPMPVLGFLALGAAVAAGYIAGHRMPAALPIRSTLLPPPGCAYADLSAGNVAELSPDGTMLAFMANCGETRSLWIRNLASGDLKQIAGTEGATAPFWSPDSRSLGLFGTSQLKRVDLQSGAVRDLAPIVAGRGGSWSRNGVILYAPDISGPIMQVPAEGGTSAVAVQASDSTITNRLPYFLPNGRDFLYVRGSIDSVASAIWAGRLGSTAKRRVTDFGSNAGYHDGQLLYARNGVLMAQPFDPGNGSLGGIGVSLVPGLANWSFKFLGNFSIASSGDLMVYQSALELRTRVTWFDPRSQRIEPLFEAGGYRSLRMRPKGDAVLVERKDPTSGLMELWLYQIAGQGWTRLSRGPDTYFEFAWAPDGRRFSMQGASDTLVHLVSLDGTSERIFPSHGKSQEEGMDWSPDGSYLLGWRQSGTSGFDIIRTDLTDDPKPNVLFSSPGNDISPRLSPDGRLLAYISDRTGRYEVYLTRMPDAREQRQVSFNGARTLEGFRSSLTWGSDGRSLYFVGADGKLNSATVTDPAQLAVSQPMGFPAAPPEVVNLDAAADGRLLLVTDVSAGATPLTLVEHWPGLLESH